MLPARINVSTYLFTRELRSFILIATLTSSHHALNLHFFTINLIIRVNDEKIVYTAVNAALAISCI